jgi:hypothetical protein
MFRTIWTDEEINSSTPLQYSLSASGCKMKVQNTSKYALDVYEENEHVDRVEPYSFSVLPNKNYILKLNKTVVSENVQQVELVTVKSVGDEVQTGSTTFTGTMNTNITNSEINANIIGDVNAVITNSELNVNLTNSEIQANITNPNINVSGNVNVSNTVQTNITNANIPVSGNVNATITNASIPITGNVGISSGTVNATIQNAQLNSNIVNARLGTNNFIYVGTFNDTIPSGTNQKQTTMTFPEAGLYDSFIFKVTHPKSGISSFTIGSQNASFKGIPTQNPITLSSLRFPLSDTTQAATTGTLPTEEPIDKIISVLTVGGTSNGTYTFTIDVYAYNSNSFKNKTMEADRYNQLGSFYVFTDGKGGLVLNNSDIIGINALVLSDAANSVSEGILFPKSTAPVQSTNLSDYDTLRVVDGKVYLSTDIFYERELTALSNVDLNTLSVNTTFYAISPTNRPSTASAGTGFVKHYQRSSGYAIQWYETSVNTFEIWVRRQNAGTWETWKKITMA